LAGFKGWTGFNLGINPIHPANPFKKYFTLGVLVNLCANASNREDLSAAEIFLFRYI